MKNKLTPILVTIWLLSLFIYSCSQDEIKTSNERKIEIGIKQCVDDFNVLNQPETSHMAPPPPGVDICDCINEVINSTKK